MAATYTVTKRAVFVVGDRKMVVGSIEAAGTPTAGGDALAAADLGLELVLDTVILGNAYKADGSAVLGTAWDHTDNKISFTTAAATTATTTALDEYSGSTDDYFMEFIAVGKGSAALSNTL